MAAILDIPQYNISLTAGDILKLSKHSIYEWMLGYGWYSPCNQAPTCGWYLMRCDAPGIVKSLDAQDLSEVVIVRSRNAT